MHGQVLLIKPETINVQDVMYWYDECINASLDFMKNDERFIFYTVFKEEDAPVILDGIKEGLEAIKNKYHSKIEYYSNHMPEEYREYYNEDYNPNYTVYYKETCDDLKEYANVKDYPIEDKRLQDFIIDNSWVCNKDCDYYIKNNGFGMFINPYTLYDYYAVVDEIRFPRGTNFLISNNGVGSNEVYLSDLNIPDTLRNIYSLTRVWEQIIFCEKDPKDSRLYTTNSIRFSDEYNRECLVDDLEVELKRIQENYKDSNMNYTVTALDFHW